jgi:multicomponent Na+:H+ antiporter subunit G
VEIVAGTLILIGAFFFLAGTVGLLRFPDTLSRIHALTKADNVGLGCIVLGTLLLGTDILSGIKLIAVWLLVLASSTTACYMIAGSTLRRQRDLNEDRG